MVKEALVQGGISQIFPAVSVVLVFFSWMWEPLLFGIGAHVIFLISAILYMISIRKISRRFSGSPIGRISTIYGLVTGIIALVLYIIAQISYEMMLWFGVWRNYAVLFLIMSAVTIGGTATLIGVFFLAYRKYFVYEPFWIATGIIYVITGMTFLISYSVWTYYLFAFDSYMTAFLVVGIVGIIVGSIEGTVCFLVSKPKEST